VCLLFSFRCCLTEVFTYWLLCNTTQKRTDAGAEDLQLALQRDALYRGIINFYDCWGPVANRLVITLNMKK